MAWWISQDHLRSKYKDFSRAAAIELRKRLADPQALEEIFVLPSPDEIWAARKLEKVERKAARLKARLLEKTAPAAHDPNDISDLI